MFQEFATIGTRYNGLIMVYPPNIDNDSVTIVLFDKSHNHQAEFELMPDDVTALINALKGESE